MERGDFILSNVDKRVVQMEFDNKQFEKDMQATVKSLKNFEKDINSMGGNTKAFNGLEKGLQNVQSNVKGFNLSPISDAFDKVKVTISGWEMAAMAAITRVVDGAMNAAQNMARSLIVDPVRQGFSEYELKMNSIQTMMMGSGASLDEVNKKLDELNKYADKTIYSFSDMTQNIGKFINAGVSLDDSVAAIQGVSNVAAISGANADEASRAMYNFAQALSSGYVKLIDWKSIENANMATVEFKNELIKTAKALGTVVQEGDYYISTTTDAQGKVSDVFNATKSFNDSLSAQWMTTEVLTETLKKYTDETTELGKKAFAAAQDVKTFSQLMDTLKEAVGSGWAQTWEIVFGNFDQAKNLWTSISNVVGGFIDKQSKARNEMLKTWANMGGRASLLESFKNLFQNIGNVINAVKEAFQEIFPPLTGKKLVSLTREFAGFVTRLELTKEELGEIKSVFKSAFQAIKSAISPISKAWKDAFPLGTIFSFVKKTFSLIGTIVKSTSDMFNGLTNNGEVIRKILFIIFNSIQRVISVTGFLFDVTKRIMQFVSPIINFISKIIGYLTDLGLSVATIFTHSEKLREAMSKLSAAFDRLVKPIRDGLAGAFDKLNPYLDGFKKWADDAIGWLSGKLGSAIGVVAGFVESLADKLTGSSSSFDSVSKGAQTASDKLDIYKSKVKDTTNTVIDSIKNNKIINTVWSGISKFFSTIWNYMKKFASGVKNTLDPIVDSFKQAGALSTIGDIIKNVSKSIGEGVKSIIQGAAPAKEALLKLFGTDSLIDLIQKFVGFFVQLKLGKLAGGIGQFLSKLSESDGILDKVKEAFDSFVKGITKPLDAFKSKQPAFKNFATAVLMLAGALFLVSKVPVENLGTAVLALIGVVTAFSSIMIVMNKTLSKNKGAASTFSAIALLMLSFAKTISKMIIGLTALIVVIDKVDNTGAVVGATIIVGLITTLIGAFGILFAKFAKTKMSANSIAAFALLIKSIGSAIKGIAIVIGILSLFNKEKVIAAGIVIGILTAEILLGLIQMISKGSQYGLTGGQITAFALLIKSIGSAIKGIAIVIGILSLFDTTKVIVATIMVSLIGALLGGFIYLTKYVDNGSFKKILALSLFVKAIGSSIKAISIVIALLGILPTAAVLQGTLVVGLITILLSALAGIASFASGSNMQKSAKGILLMAASIAIISLAIIKLSKIDLLTVVTILGALTASFMILSGALVGMSFFAKNIEILGKAFLMFGVAAAAFGAGVYLIVKAVKIMNKLGPQGIQTMTDMITAIVSNIPKWVALLITGFLSALTQAIPSIAESLVNMLVSIIQTVTKSAGTIVTAIVGLFKAIASAISASGTGFNISDLFWAIQAIALIAGLIYILQVISSDMGAAIKGIALMAIVLAALVGSLVIINQFTNPDESIEILKGIATTLISLAGMFALVAGVAIAFEKLKISFTSILKAIGAFAVFLLAITVIVGLIGLIGNWIGSENIDNILNMAITIMSKVGQAIGSFMSSIAESLLKVIPDKNGIAQILAIVPLILALEPLITALPILGALFLALGGIMAIIDGIFGEGTSKQLLELVNNVMPVLAEGIGTFLGILIKKVLEIATDALMNSLVAFAEGLSDFMEALQPFLDSVKQIDGSMLEKVGMLTLMMLEMAAVELVTALTNFLTLFTGKSSMADFAKQLVDMAPYLVKFSSILKKGKFDSDITNKAANAALMLTTVANNLPKSGGLLQWFIGNTMDMDDFGSRLEGLGKSLVKFGKQVNNLTPEQVKSMGIAAEAATQLTEVAKSMPKSGGLWQRIVGETTNMDDFGTKLEGLGASLVKFAKSVEGITSTQITAVKNTIPIMKSLVEIADDMPTEGGIWSKIVGDKMDMADFGGKLTALGEGLAGFAEKVKDIQNDTTGTTSRAVNICKDLVEISKSIGEEKSGGLAQWFGGNSKEDIESWGNKLPALGTGFAGFSDAVKNIKNVGSLSPITAAIKTLSEIELGKSISETNFDQLLENIGWLANGTDSGDSKYTGPEDFSKIANAFGNITADKANSVKTKVENISAAISSILEIANVDGGNEDGFKQKLNLIHLLYKGFGKDGYYNGTGDITGIFDDFKNSNLEDAKKVTSIISELVGITNQTISKDSFVGDTLDRIGKMVHGDGDDYEGIDDFKAILDAFEWSDVNHGKQHAEDVKEILTSIIGITNADVNTDSFYDVLAQVGALAGNATNDIKYYTGPDDFKTILTKFNGIGQYKSEDIDKIIELLDGIVGVINHDFDTDDFDDVLTGIGKMVHGGVGKYQGVNDFKTMASSLNGVTNGGEKLKSFIQGFNNLVAITNTPVTGSDFSEKTLNRIGYIVNGNGDKYNGVTDIAKFANAFGDEVGSAASGETRMKSVSNGVTAMIEAFNGISFGDDEATAFNKALESVSDFTVITTKEAIINKTEGILAAIKTLLKKMADAFVDKTEQSNLKTNVNTWVSNIASAITASTSDTKKAMETLIKDVLKTVHSFNSQDPTKSTDSFYSAGQSSVYGYIEGIKSRLQLAYNTGKLIGSEALKGTQNALDSHSPSREYGKLAFNSIMGFINTIRDKASLVFDAGSELGTNALNGTKGIITKIGNIINSDMNLQPVISPILDLSDMSAQSGQINGILNAGASVIAANGASNLIEQGRMIRLDARLNQNGSPDVVDAITNLTNRMDSLEKTIVNRPIMLDKTKVSKELTPEIDKNLGRRAYYSRRGN